MFLKEPRFSLHALFWIHRSTPPFLLSPTSTDPVSAPLPHNPSCGLNSHDDGQSMFESRLPSFPKTLSNVCGVPQAWLWSLPKVPCGTGEVAQSRASNVLPDTNTPCYMFVIRQLTCNSSSGGHSPLFLPPQTSMHMWHTVTQKHVYM